MLRLSILAAATSTLALAAGAWGALPTTGAFAGKTSLRPINGFPDLVTFKAAASHKALTKFQFGTLGCFGHGNFPVGTDPYGDATAIGTVKSVPLTTKGVFDLKTKPTFPGADGIVTTATIKGSFTSATAVSGSITISQSDNGDVCGPSTMKFTAQPGTPDSLGFTGP